MAEYAAPVINFRAGECSSCPFCSLDSSREWIENGSRGCFHGCVSRHGRPHACHSAQTRRQHLRVECGGTGRRVITSRRSTRAAAHRSDTRCIQHRHERRHGDWTAYRTCPCARHFPAHPLQTLEVDDIVMLQYGGRYCEQDLGRHVQVGLQGVRRRNTAFQ